MTDENHIRMNTVVVQTLSDQIVGIAGKMEHLSPEHRGTLVQVSGILHSVLLDLALCPSAMSADQPVEPKDPVHSVLAIDVDVNLLRGKIGREPNAYDVFLCSKVGYPEFQVSQPVWLLRDGDKLKCTIVGVKAFNNHQGPHWKYKVTQFDDLVMAFELHVVTQ